MDENLKVIQLISPLELFRFEGVEGTSRLFVELVFKGDLSRSATFLADFLGDRTFSFSILFAL